MKAWWYKGETIYGFKVGESQIYKYLITKDNITQFRNQEPGPSFKPFKYLYNPYKCGDFKLIKISHQESINPTALNASDHHCFSNTERVNLKFLFY